MLKIRSTDGKAYKLNDKAKFIEICDNEGNIAAVVFIRSDGIIRICKLGEEEFNNYITAFRLHTSKLINTNG